MSNNNSNITITLVSPVGQSESIEISPTSTTLADLLEWTKALFGLDDSNAMTLSLTKDGQQLASSSQQTKTTTTTVQQAGIRHGDVIAVVVINVQQEQRQQMRTNSAPAASSSSGGSSTTGGGLDFSNLLSSSSSTTPSAASASSNHPSSHSHSPVPIHYPGMQLDDAMIHNPHPLQFVTLLQQNESIRKQFHHYHPRLASQIEQVLSGTTSSSSSSSVRQEAASIWQRELVRGGIRTAMQRTETYHKDREMRLRLEANPNDQDASEYFERQSSRALIQAQYETMMNDFPESMGKILMLYIGVKVNGHNVQAFVDSGAQATIMSKQMARSCGLLHLVDTRFAGVAVGVGTGTIMGRIHLVSLQIGTAHFPCTVTIMDDDDVDDDRKMNFLLGLDMLKRHQCHVDLEHHCVKFKLTHGTAGGMSSSSSSSYMEAPFLHEKDLDASKGGTRGFNAEQANQELFKQQQQQEEEEDEEKEQDTKKKRGRAAATGDDDKDEGRDKIEE